ncbi:MAG: carbohydrate ABC transporter permease [Candidatus Borkfalkiaceae bacterium]|nr:carbohydrate ABC transporter permease [Christensenellaceae bacterium]
MKRRTAITGRKRRMTAGDYTIYVLMGLAALIALYPFWFVLIGSFNEGEDYLSGGVWLYTRVFDASSYGFVLRDARLWNGFKTTILRVVFGVSSALLYTSMTAYGMTRRNLKFKKFFYWANIVAMFFGGGLIPFYLWMITLGLYENFFAYIFPGLYSVYNMIVFSSFFRSIPEEMHEAALVDGASEYLIMFKIYFPMSLPAFATVGLWLGLAHWNNYFDTMIYCSRTESLHTLQYYLLQVIKESSSTESEIPPEMKNRINTQTISYAAIVIATIPVLCMFPLIQKIIKKGVTVGSLKG